MLPLVMLTSGEKGTMLLPPGVSSDNGLLTSPFATGTPPSEMPHAREMKRS